MMIKRSIVTSYKTRYFRAIFALKIRNKTRLTLGKVKFDFNNWSKYNHCRDQVNSTAQPRDHTLKINLLCA